MKKQGMRLRLIIKRSLVVKRKPTSLYDTAWYWYMVVGAGLLNLGQVRHMSPAQAQHAARELMARR